MDPDHDDVALIFNVTLVKEATFSHSDKEFGEFFSSFQRLNDCGANILQPEKKCKNKKLLIGDS